MSDFRGTIHQCECPEVADSRRLGDEIHQRPPNGDVRPEGVVHESQRECLVLTRTADLRRSDREGLPLAGISARG